MGLLSWWRRRGSASAPVPATATIPVKPQPSQPGGEAPDMNGAEEVRRPSDITVFEFGNPSMFGGKSVMIGYCPTSEELEPCRWKVHPRAYPNEPPFRIVF